jgi:hypothetical protein
MTPRHDIRQTLSAHAAGKRPVTLNTCSTSALVSSGMSA